MSSASPRTRTVETITKEEQPVPESSGLGMGWEDFLASCPDDELEIATVKLYRQEPAGQSGYIERLQPAERIDEEWIKARHGGGVYAINIRVKNGKSAYERGIRILGEPKLPNAPAAPPVQTSANGAEHSTNARILELLEKTIERLENRTAAPAPSEAQNASVKLMGEAASEAIKLVASNAGERRTEPPKSALGELENLFALIDRLKPKEDPLDRELRAAFIKKITDPPPAPTATGGVIEQATQLGQLIEVIDKLRGEGGAGKGDWKSVLIEKFGDAAPGLIELAKNFLDGRKAISESELKREELRKKNIETVRSMQQPAAAIAAAAPVVSASPPARGSAPASPIPPASPGAGSGPGPLQVVPIHPEQRRDPSAADLDAVAAEEDIARATTAPAVEEHAAMLESWFKNRVVQLVEEGTDPVNVLAFIDGASPATGLMLSRATEQQLRDHLAADPILVRLTKLPHYDEFLTELLAIIAEDAAAAEVDRLPANHKVQ